MKEQTEVGKLKEGRYVIVDDEPCRIVSIAVSKPGKHGAAKSRIECVGIFDGVKRSIVQPVSAKIYVPIVERKIAQVISIAGTNVQFMDIKDFEMFELNLTEEQVSDLEPGREIAYITSLGKKKLE
ncbi:MAG TPA: translation initiation factor IF-5A [Candidatus Methanoculleus thermohydrogenotrophicum]|jgi:translation initiation factor 5A|nr:translation initiation factor IF-5A [Candidatus Methanoculleus thermohydrogenotrophicum]NLM81682.1 translation initiation factor IF-5A [Candidatus Methanoculleus thermohydrogenotrophicum]HOB17550.1 translation initiation factor IF-5A [Candidatus Methanoculleus thermohydrogenotrophicum]HPZ37706.1 translation initiation factor IF-5A [Candidatus Methanoculleus thermohydrogenotrophicum]HQC90809.1 translation initiation factor IF-5A [Candidatus Methanoculleus thermohydrogenotrophicum]